MPDRAVVDDDGFVPWTTNGTIRTQDGQQIWPQLQPRALCALSEDRQWLVTPDPDVSPPAFVVWKWAVPPLVGWLCEEYVLDTGQSAHEVLEQFVKERANA